MENIKIELIDHAVEEVLQREVSAYGNGAHVIVPKKHLGKDVVVLIVQRK